MSILINAVRRNNIELVKLLLDAGANPNKKDNISYTALIYAVQYGYIEIVQLLLEAGVWVNIQNNIGDTALIEASLNGNIEIIELLLATGADPNIRNNDDDTALMWASQMGHIEIVELLLEVDADPNIRNFGDDTALIFASQMGYIEIVGLLLDAGANPNIRNNNGRIAYDVALINNNYEIADLLKRSMVTTQFQSRIRGKQTRRRIRTQTAKQNLAFTKGLEDRPLIYGRHVRYEPNIDQLISEKLSSMSYNPEVARRMKEEEKMLPYTDWLQEFSQYGSGIRGSRRHSRSKRSSLSRRRKRRLKYTRNRFY